MDNKPLGIKNYGSIGHLPNSRMGVGDHSIHAGQASIATEKLSKNKRGLEREVIVQEKLDGSNVGIARVNGRIFALSRAGYPCNTSPFEQHHAFEKWVMKQLPRWDFIQEGERLVGEWLMQAHSTRYKLEHEPFVAFDLMTGDKRVPYDEFLERIKSAKLTTPYLIHRGQAISEKEVMQKLGKFGFHGAIDEVEGAVWRVELINPKGQRTVEYLTKFVRPEKKDGIYLKDEDGNVLPPIFNWIPSNNS